MDRYYFTDDTDTMAEAAISNVVENSTGRFGRESGGTLHGKPVGSAGTAVRQINGTAAPSITPDFIGQVFVDSVNKKIYHATGVATSGDWTVVN
jgi:hypothetical protein